MYIAAVLSQSCRSTNERTVALSSNFCNRERIGLRRLQRRAGGERSGELGCTPEKPNQALPGMEPLKAGGREPLKFPFAIADNMSGWSKRGDHVEPAPHAATTTRACVVHGAAECIRRCRVGDR